MANLNEIVGGVLQGLVTARAGADEFSANIAAEYAENGLLQHFSVPFFDIQDVDIQLRFAVESVTNGVISVAVKHTELEAIPEKSISTIRFKAVLQNKIWLSSNDTQSETLTD